MDLWVVLLGLLLLLGGWPFTATTTTTTTTTVLAASPTSNDEDGNNVVHTCTSIYLAKSSILGAGWGVFAAKDYDVGDSIGTPSIGIPFLDFPVGEDETTISSIFGGLGEYLWESTNIGGFGEGLRVDMFLPGPPSLVNHFAGLENVIPAGLYHDTKFHRFSNLMAGSFSAYSTTTSSSSTTTNTTMTMGTLIATRKIQAGEELFIDRTYQTQLAHPAYIRDLPLVQEYQIIDEMVQSIAKEGYPDTLTMVQFHDLLHRFSSEIIPAGFGGSGGEEETTTTTKFSIPTPRVVILQQLFPRSLREFKQCLEKGSAKYRLIPRELKELEQHGHCMDTISSQPSTIPDAGHGAFATRSLSKGTIISLSPMVTVTNGPYAMQLLYRFLSSEYGDNNATQQLLLNYCLGHAESELLLCPTTQAALMNHAPSTVVPNVGIRWYHDPDIPEYDQWILKSLQDTTTMDASNPKTMQARLAMEYVALRDIKEGEELFLGYPMPWQDALETHLQHGSSSAIMETDSISAKIWNDEYRAVIPSEDLHHMGLAYFCQVYPHVKIDENSIVVEWEDFYANAAVDPNTWPPEFRHMYQNNEAAAMYPCIVIGEAQNKGHYNVEMLLKPVSLSQVGRRFLNIPRDRIRFVDSLYRSDMHLKSAFRHHVPISDSLFPMQWRTGYMVANDVKLGRWSEEEWNRVHQDSYEQSLRDASCGLYLAPSNIVGAGFGVYTGVNIPVAGIAISTLLPVIPSLADAEQHLWMGKDYVWSSRLFHMATLEGYPRFETAFISFLFGALANAHAGINNILHDTGEWDPLLDAVTDYGTGAFTDYVRTAFRSAYPIKAGEELYVSYGEEWFRYRPNLKDVPLSENFRRANFVVASIWTFLSINQVDDAIIFFASLLSIIKERFVEKTDARTSSVFKGINVIQDFYQIIERGGTAEATVQVRSEDWLARNGYCLDHIYVTESSIPNAGRGAFNRRPIRKDSIIISSPALVTSRWVLYANQTPTPEQTTELHLLTNYHFGHKNSSLLFFPLVTSAFFNHANDGRRPNARFQFSTTNVRSMYFQSLLVEDVLEVRKALD